AKPEQTSVLVTFALALIMEGLMGVIFQTTARSVAPSYSTAAITLLGFRLPVTRLAGFGAAILVLLALYYILQRTNVGRAIRATIQDPRAAQLVGVKISSVSAFTFALGVGTAAAGGSLLSMIYSFNPASQGDWVGKTLAIIVLGGMGSLPGALVASLILGVMEQLTAILVTLYWSPIVFYIFLFFTLIVRPQGLMGEVIREKG
ncbi:MAG: branched-chain amino acid ABC transporter permease, partial [Bacteroidota bacterium]